MQSQLETMKINERGMPLYQPILLTVLRTGLCARACFYLADPKILQIQVPMFPGDMGGNQIGCHRVFNIIAPGDHANSKLISEYPSYLLPYYVNSDRW
jgi:hypothetical protein